MIAEFGASFEMAQKSTILRCDIGSRGFGLNGLTSDHDHKAICIEDYETAMNFGNPWEQWGPHKWKVDELAQYPEGLDLEIYSLRKFVQLAMKGNPNVLCMLFTSEPLFRNDVGRELQLMSSKFISQHAASAFSGYMDGQENRLKTKGRPQYVQRYGFDVKFAMHLIRIGYQGIELLKTGSITMPFPDGDDRDHLLAIREGKVAYDDVLAEAVQLHSEIDSLRRHTKLPAEPDRDYLLEWMRRAYWEEWEGQMALDRLLRETYSDSIH